MKYLLDTNVISETRRTDRDETVSARLAAAASEELFISVISVGEIAFGVSRLDKGKRRHELEEWLGQTELYFAERILPVDSEVARIWGAITAKAADKGRTLHAADGLIAATALRHGLCLMTRNTKDFELTGVALVNPWKDP